MSREVEWLAAIYRGSDEGRLDRCMALADAEVAAAVAEERATRMATQDAMHADLSDLLDALGMGTHARPDSPHAVMQQAIAKVRALVEERAATGRRAADAEELAEVFRDTVMQLYATIDRAVDAETELAGLRERIEAEEREHLETIAQRDDAEDWADRLTLAIGEHLGIDFGEHSSAVLPWADALAALASPGGRWVHVTRGDECPEQPTPSQVIGDFRPTTTSGEPWWCTTHQDHLRWLASPGEES